MDFGLCLNQIFIGLMVCVLCINAKLMSAKVARPCIYRFGFVFETNSYWADNFRPAAS